MRRRRTSYRRGRRKRYSRAYRISRGGVRL